MKNINNLVYKMSIKNETLWICEICTKGTLESNKKDSRLFYLFVEENS